MMRIEEYRDLIDACFGARLSVLSAATTYEKRAEVMRMRDAVARLKEAKTRRPSERDSRRAAFAIETCELLAELNQKQFDKEDALICKLDFAAEWR